MFASAFRRTSSVSALLLSCSRLWCTEPSTGKSDASNPTQVPLPPCPHNPKLSQCLTQCTVPDLSFAHFVRNSENVAAQALRLETSQRQPEKRYFSAAALPLPVVSPDDVATATPNSARDRMVDSFSDQPYVFKDQSLSKVSKTLYGGKAVSRLLEREYRLRIDDTYANKRPLFTNGKEQKNTMSGRELFGFSEALIGTLAQTDQLKNRGILTDGIDAANQLFSEFASLENELEIRKGVILDLFGEVRNDFRDLLSSNARERRRALAEQGYDESSLFLESQTSDLPTTKRPFHSRLRIGVGGIGTDTERLRVTGRVEWRFGKGSLVPYFLQGGTWYVVGESRPFMSTSSEDVFKNKTQYQLLGGYSVKF